MKYINIQMLLILLYFLPANLFGNDIAMGDSIKDRFTYADTISKDSLLKMVITYNRFIEDDSINYLAKNDLIDIVIAYNTSIYYGFHENQQFKRFIHEVGGETKTNLLLLKKLEFGDNFGGGVFSKKYNLEFMGRPNKGSKYFLHDVDIWKKTKKY